MGITTCRLEGPVDFYSVGQFVSGPGWRHLRRTIDTFELMFVRRGVLPMRVGERTLHIEAGQIALLPPNVEHAGADIITIHIEATEDLPAAIRTIKACGVKAGVSIKPKTPVSAIVPYLTDLDLVLIMSVEPGFGGQPFIEGSTEKVAELRREIDRCGSNTLIEIDGGITLGNAGAQFAAGCDVLVAGNTIFGSDDPTRTIHDLLRA